MSSCAVRTYPELKVTIPLVQMLTRSINLHFEVTLGKMTPSIERGEVIPALFVLRVCLIHAVLVEDLIDSTPGFGITKTVINNSCYNASKENSIHNRLR